MKNFLVIYNAPAASAEQMAQTTPEQQAQIMEEWMKWKAQAGNAVVDFGAPTLPGHNATSPTSWSHSNNQISGYSILQANSADEVKALFANHPHLKGMPGYSIDVHETMVM